MILLALKHLQFYNFGNRVTEKEFRFWTEETVKLFPTLVLRDLYRHDKDPITRKFVTGGTFYSRYRKWRKRLRKANLSTDEDEDSDKNTSTASHSGKKCGYSCTKGYKDVSIHTEKKILTVKTFWISIRTTTFRILCKHQ